MKIYFIIYIVLVLLCQYKVLGEPQVPGFFIFGDSFSDNGNNNNLITQAKVNYKPYGLDFPKGPTGRFTNGQNLADFIAKYLGFPNYIPPFAKVKYSKGSQILQGVNYASGGAGIRNDTSKAQGQVISLDQQLKNHNYTISKVQSLMRNNKNATTYLKSCLYMVEMGINDYINNYFLSDPYTTNVQFSPQEYATDLIQQLSSKLKILYSQGARKFAVFGVWKVGCMPLVRGIFGTKGSSCVEKANNDAQLFNIGLKSLVQDLNANLPHAKFININMFSIANTLGTSNQGDQIVSDVPCCEVASNKTQCLPFGKVCANRTKYIYWDRVHPTEDPFMELAKRSFNAQLSMDTYPYDISHLVKM